MRPYFDDDVKSSCGLFTAKCTLQTINEIICNKLTAKIVSKRVKTKIQEANPCRSFSIYITSFIETDSAIGSLKSIKDYISPINIFYFKVISNY